MKTIAIVCAFLFCANNLFAQKPYKIKSDTLNLSDLSVTRNEDYLQTVNGSLTLNISFEQGELRQVHLSFPMIKPFFILLPDVFLKVKLVEGIQAELIRPALYKVTPVGEGTLIFSK
jgi:hypothetical protein